MCRRGFVSSASAGPATTAGPAALTPLLHGNGFWSSGAMDAQSKSPLPQSNSVTFASAGTYEFYCLIHTFMHGTITAQ